MVCGLNLSKTIGIDLNSKEHVLSDGTRFLVPKFLRENQVQLKNLQRNLARKKKGSTNKAKAAVKLRKVNDRVTNRRADYFHKLSKTLVDDYDLICIEDLDVKDIQQKYGKVIQDNGFAMLRSFLTYKTDLYGKHLSVINRWYPSSQECSACHSLNKHLLSERTYRCKSCGFELDRDLNAAIVIEQVGTTSPEVQVFLPSKNAFGATQTPQLNLLIGILGRNELGSSVL